MFVICMVVLFCILWFDIVVLVKLIFEVWVMDWVGLFVLLVGVLEGVGVGIVWVKVNMFGLIVVDVFCVMVFVELDVRVVVE